MLPPRHLIPLLLTLLLLLLLALPFPTPPSPHLLRLRRMSATERSLLSTGHSPPTARALAISTENALSHSPPSSPPPDPHQQRLVIARLLSEDPMREGLLFPRPGSGRWASPREELERLFMFKTLVLFSKKGCPWSKKAKKLLRETYRVDPMVYVVELDEIERGREIQEELGRMTGRRTVPNLMVSKYSLGGFDELNRLHEEGKLAEALHKYGGDRVRNVWNLEG